jgi:hypothetical protein
MKRYFVLVASLILGCLAPLQGTSVRRLNVDELIAAAQSIIEGSVVSSNTYRSSDGKLIFTSYTINVQENLKGSAHQTVTVTTIGGRIGNTILHVAGMPVFQPGDRAIFFLEQSKSFTTIVGLNQGKFAISNGEVSNSMSGLSFPDGAAGNSVKMPLDEFKKQIKLRINR